VQVFKIICIINIIIHDPYTLGTKEYNFQTPIEFTLWKETVEEESHTYYTKEKEYKPSEGSYTSKYVVILYLSS